MMAQTTTEARFINGTKGRLFAMHRRPLNRLELGECFVLAPPFAEEMNRCRYMCTMISQQLAEQGHGFLSVDPYGTGDSEGNFVDADWDGWTRDIVAACEYAMELGYTRISLLGIRLGALLALNAAADMASLHRIVLWQPVISGKTSLTQFMRIRIAASLERDEDGGSVGDFEKSINEGKPVQVAGYDVSPALYTGIKTAHFDSHLEFHKSPIAWFNTLASEDRKTPRIETDFLKKWREQGADIHHETVIGPSYWAVHERTLAPALVKATARHIAGDN